MTATASYSSAMADLKTSPNQVGMWPNYGTPMSVNTRFGGGGGMDSMSGVSVASPHSARPRSAQQTPTPGPGDTYTFSRYPPSQDEAGGGGVGADPYERQQHHSHPGLTSHSSFPSLKRTFSQTEQQQHVSTPYPGMVHHHHHQEVRGGIDEGPKLGVGHDHKLLALKKAPDKHTIVDQHGRIQTLDMSAQLHGMFFLSEMPSGPDGSAQAELTCYRRNLFQISGSLITPRGQMSVVGENGETLPVTNTEVTISAIESVDENSVRLIVIPWKTPPPNSPEISQGPDAEPPTLPLIPFQDDGAGGNGEYAVYPIGWRRLQFRVATANNGRRKELQQHFVLHLKVVATLSDGSRAVLSESVTSPIVVRGRSPRNFQTRKEIPLLGSSAGSRGQALVETGLGIVAGPLTAKPGDGPRAKGLSVTDMQVPRSAFTFSASKMLGMPAPAMRSNSYPAWTPQNHLGQMPASGPASSYPPAATTMGGSPDSDSLYGKMVPLSADSGDNGSYAVNSAAAAAPPSEPQQQPQQQQHQDMSLVQNPMSSVSLPMAAADPPTPIRTQYAYAPSSAPMPLPPSGSAGPPGSSHQTLSMQSPGAVAVAAAAAAMNNIPRYVDGGGSNHQRPTKSPRGLANDSVHGGGGSVSNESPSEYRYGPYPPSMVGGAGAGSGGAEMQLPYGSAAATVAAASDASGSQVAESSTSREYYPPHSNSWVAASGPGDAAAVPAAAAAAFHPSSSSTSSSPSNSSAHPHEGRSYTFPNTGYKAGGGGARMGTGMGVGASSGGATPHAGTPKTNHLGHHQLPHPHHHQHHQHHHPGHPPAAAAVYGAGHHAAYDGLSNYSWNGS